MEDGELNLVGVTHSKESYKETPNYLSIKEFLEKSKPAFVTCEVRLHQDPLLAFDKRTLTFPLERLDTVEKDILSEPQYGSEYEAAAIYCRRNGIPLFYIDLYDSPVEEVASANILEMNPDEVWNDEKPMTPQQTEDMSDDQKRNEFMSSALVLISSRFPNSLGVHIGGGGHYVNGEDYQPLQELIPAHLRVKVVSLES